MMKKVTTAVLFVFIILIIVLMWRFLNPTDIVDFNTDIRPIINKNCIACHGGVKKNAGFSLLFKEEALGNTESGRPAIIPGNASGSELIKRLREDNPALRMPYNKPKLSDKEIDLITQWIDQGAQWGKHWAYSLPKKVEVPVVIEETDFSSGTSSEPSFIKNGIDHFILSRLKSEQLKPNEPAEKHVIARRLALDLIGLPPSKELFNAYTSNAITYENMVDSLLSQQSYGEKWASWWLDLARYADTKGYEQDQGRTMWQYRDWVIRALNNDLPFDQFTKEQLAGDLLSEPSTQQIIATAFHRNTMNNDEGGTEDEEFRVAAVIDRVNTTFEVWQSTTIGCVQCHSHPSDPFKHKDYYNLMSFFNNSRDEDTSEEEPNLNLYNAEQLTEVKKIENWVSRYGTNKTVKNYKNFLIYKEPVYHAHLCENFINSELADTKWLALRDNGSCNLKKVYTNGASFMYLYYRSDVKGTTMTIKRDNADGEILAQFQINKTKGKVIRKIPFKKVDENVNLYFEANNNDITADIATSYITWFAFLEDMPGKSQPDYKAINASFLKLLNTKTPTIPIMVENPENMKRITQIFERGNWLSKADTVQPGTPKVLNQWESEWPKNRLGLSQWIVSKKNPLTARTLVNRIWHQFFGRGIVANLESMGALTDPPSHGELLDWLSLRLMNEQEWSVKALIKDIVMSGTYRQNSINSLKSYQLDPENRLYARGPRLRLSAEQIRDQALTVSGLLSLKMFGPGVMPPQPEGVWETVYSDNNWTVSKGEDRYRRAVYTYFKRTSPYPSFLTFDAGSREVCTIRRTVTNTPLQALVTLNDPVYLEAAYHLAKTVYTENDIEKSISMGYKRATFSEITPKKLDALKELYLTALVEFENNSEEVQLFLPFEDNPPVHLGALTVVANAIMNLDEFLTKA